MHLFGKNDRMVVTFSKERYNCANIFLPYQPNDNFMSLNFVNAFFHLLSKVINFLLNDFSSDYCFYNEIIFFLSF